MSTNENQNPSGGGAAGAEQEASHEGAQANGGAGAGQADFENYRTFPALAAYINRVGAEQRNFRRFIVKQQGAHGYNVVQAVITLKADGTITVKGDAACAPNDAERAAITAACAQLSFPTSVTASESAAETQRRALGVERENWFTILDDNRTTVVMVQQRLTLPNGKKAYLPWTFFSDGKWRRMEPDAEALPLWKPKQRRSTVMLHEGAKPAAYCDWLANSPEARALLAAHPFAAAIKDAEHWGWIGGALSPHRTDWASVRRQDFMKVDLICDNDEPGMAAARYIARALMGENFWVVFFNEQFPVGFDLADPIPARLFKQIGDRRVYSGPSFYDFERCAIWATETVPTEKPGRPAHKLRPAFLRQWAWSIAPPVFVNIQMRRKLHSIDEFNRSVRPFSDVADTAALLENKHDERKVDGVCYQPGDSSFFVNKNHERLINTWMATTIPPMAGDDEPWITFMENLFPLKVDRDNVYQWCATLIARPDVRMTYGVLLIQKKQGIGKSTLMEKILLPLVGEHNCSLPNEKEIVDGAFNYWQAYRRLVVVHEIYAGHSRKAYDKLKSVMTDKKCDVNIKNIKQHTIDNWVTIIAASNSRQALHMAQDDRRWLVPEVSNVVQSNDYWTKFNNWLVCGGLNIIHQWAIDYVAKHGAVSAGEHAPDSLMKKEITKDSMSDGELLLVDLAEAMLKRTDYTVVTDRAVRAWLGQHRGMGIENRALESLVTIRDTLIDAGLREVKGRKIMGIRHRWLANHVAAAANAQPSQPGAIMPQPDTETGQAQPEAPTVIVPEPPF